MPQCPNGCGTNHRLGPTPSNCPNYRSGMSPLGIGLDKNGNKGNTKLFSKSVSNTKTKKSSDPAGEDLQKTFGLPDRTKPRIKGEDLQNYGRVVQGVRYGPRWSTKDNEGCCLKQDGVPVAFIGASNTKNKSEQSNQRDADDIPRINCPLHKADEVQFHIPGLDVNGGDSPWDITQRTNASRDEVAQEVSESLWPESADERSVRADPSWIADGNAWTMTLRKKEGQSQKEFMKDVRMASRTMSDVLRK